MPCGDAIHHLTVSNDSLILHDHELQPERVLDALGGKAPQCLQLLDAWRSTDELDAVILARVLAGDPSTNLETKKFLNSLSFQVQGGLVGPDARDSLRQIETRVTTLLKMPSSARHRYIELKLGTAFKDASTAVAAIIARISRMLSDDAIDLVYQSELKKLADLPRSGLNNENFSEDELLSLSRAGRFPSEPSRKKLLSAAVVSVLEQERAFTLKEILECLRAVTANPDAIRLELIKSGLLVRDGRKYRRA
jgi:hypothetical protein